MKIADKEYLLTIDEKAEKLKRSILEDISTPAYTGKAFYVSASGDDANDGLSPETPVASLNRITTLPLEEGDAVLFKRGDLFRGNVIVPRDGITFAAYGEGKKPRISASPENAASPYRWEKSEWENIWHYKVRLDNLDIGHMLFDGRNGNKKILRHHGFSGKPEDLAGDLEFFQDQPEGALYVFSAEGNPGERFCDIEMFPRVPGFAVGKHNNTHIDNLCIMHVGVHGVSAGTLDGLRVTNCEIGYIGGSIQYVKGDAPATRFGNGVEIYGSCRDFLVDRCYIHDVYDAGVTHQRKGKGDIPFLMENVTYSNNLFEHCIYSIEYFCDQENSDEDMMRHIRMTNNICRFAGGFGWQRPNKVARHIQGGWLNCKRKYPAEDYVVEGNIFDRSIDTLLSVSSVRKEHLPVMKGNTYIQYAGKNFGINDVPYDHYEPFDDKIEDYIRNYRNEPDAEIYVVPEYDGKCDY